MLSLCLLLVLVHEMLNFAFYFLATFRAPYIRFLRTEDLRGHDLIVITCGADDGACHKFPEWSR